MKTDPSAPLANDSKLRGPAPSGRQVTQRRRRRWKWILLGAFMAVIVIGAVSARPAWRAVKAVRAQRFLTEAEEFARKEEWTQAFERTRSALQLAPANARVLRHAAQLHARFGLDTALGFYERLVGSSAATLEDRESYAAIALSLGDSTLAGTLVEELLEAPKPSARSLLLGAQFYAMRRDMPRALRLARDCVTAQPGNPTNVLALASLLTSSRSAEDRAEALAVLWPHAKTEGTFQVRALAAILHAPDSPREDRERVEGVLASKPKRSLEEELLWFEARVSLDPSQRNRIADELVEGSGHGAPEQMAGVAGWLNQQQLYARTLGLLLPDIARQNARLARLRYDALIGLEDIRGAYDFIRAEGVPGEPLQLEFLRCATAIRLKNDAAVDSHLLNLLELARRQPRQLRAVAEFARRNGKTDIANQVNQILIRNPREAVPAFQALLRSADAQGETWVARDYARKLAGLRKDEEAVQVQIAYYDLLLRENEEQAFAKAEAFHRAKPEDFTRRAVLALAYLRRDEPAKAAGLIEGQIVTWARLPAGVRAIVAATLGANHRGAAVARLLERIPLAKLKPEERELLRPYLTQTAKPEVEDTVEEKPEKL